MLKAFKYRLYPTKAQEEKINQTIGCARLVYNLMLNAKIEYYKQNKQTLHITPAKFKNNYSFLKEIDSLALANSQINLEKAYRKFFNVPNTGFPKFKSKRKSRWSYTTNNQFPALKDEKGNSIKDSNGKVVKDYSKPSIKFDKNRIKLPRLGYVKIVEHRTHLGIIKSVIVSKERSGEYYASVLCEITQPEALPVTEKNVGIDLGLHDLIVCSDGQRVEAPKHFRKSQSNLAKEQRKFAKTQKGSNGHEKQRIKVAKCYQKIKNQRNDFLQKLSTKLINENQVICLEDLSVKGMQKNHKLAKSVSDASFAKFVSMLEYKAAWYGRTIVKIDRFYPSTQICNSCGFQNTFLKGLKGLKVREWICPECGEVHDRDFNASRNILKEGLRVLNLRNVGDSEFTACYTNRSSSIVGDVLALEAHGL